MITAAPDRKSELSYQCVSGACRDKTRSYECLKLLVLAYKGWESFDAVLH